MSAKYSVIVVALGCLAMSCADPIRSEIKGVKKPVGTCPPKDGQYPTYLPDADDCSKFYECSAGVPVLKQCMAGLCFDTTLNVCAFPESASKDSKDSSKPVIAPLSAVGTCPPRDSGVAVILPDSEDCSVYYVCSNGVPIKNECPPDLEFNPTLKVCDFPIDAGCSASKAVIVPRSAVGTCPPRDSGVAVILPDSEDCSIYYVCSNGVPIKNECPPDLEFNPILKVCDFPIDAGCSASKAVIAPLTAVGTCPPRDSGVAVILPDSDSCSVYYVCSNGVPIKNECPPDLEFNPILKVCDFPIDAGCSASKAVIAPLSAVGTCPPRDSGVAVILPDSEDCSIYYVCSNGVPIKNECPPDLEFNPTLKVCDFPIDAGCSASKAVIAPLSAVGTCPPRDSGVAVILPDSDSCSIYYVCSNGVPIKNECPPDLEFNPTLKVCDFPIDAGCSASKAVIVPLTAVGTCPPRDSGVAVILPDSDSCSIYYVCSNGVPIKNECPPDLEFNPILKVCDFPIDAGCTSSGRKSLGH